MLIVRRNMRLLRTLPINEGSRTMAFRSDWSVCGEELHGAGGEEMAPSSLLCAASAPRCHGFVSRLQHWRTPLILSGGC
jgi:hypothetical protein